jgi:hypothetical protein
MRQNDLRRTELRGAHETYGEFAASRLNAEGRHPRRKAAA